MNNKAQAQGKRLADGFLRYKTGLVIGGLIGLVSGGIFGLLFGGFIGYLLEKTISKAKEMTPQQLFFKATFSSMGKIAKADGRVSESEIELAREVMARMNLDDDAKKRAIAYFNEGKQSEFDLAVVLQPLAIVLRRRPAVKLMFIELQLAIAMADGDISDPELRVIEEICRHLRFSAQEMDAVVQRIRAAQAFQQHSYDTHGRATPGNQGMLLQDAYGVIGVAPEATDDEVKKAWRKLMSQHHPDKLVARGLPEEMMLLATEKVQEIQAAYERIREARGMR